MNDQLNKLYSRIYKEKKEKKTMSIEEMIEYNKVKFNLTHGKGLRKKHKSKNKKMRKR